MSHPNSLGLDCSFRRILYFLLQVSARHCLRPDLQRCLVTVSLQERLLLNQSWQGGVQNFPKNYNMTIGNDFIVKRVNLPESNVIVEM